MVTDDEAGYRGAAKCDGGVLFFVNSQQENRTRGDFLRIMIYIRIFYKTFLQVSRQVLFL